MNGVIIIIQNHFIELDIHEIYIQTWCYRTPSVQWDATPKVSLTLKQNLTTENTFYYLEL